MCDYLDKQVYLDIFHYLDNGNWFYYQDIRYTIVNYSKHLIVMRCVKVILNNRHPENMHNAIFIIVAHLNRGAFCLYKKIYSYCDLITLIATYMK